jgi:protein deglycase
MQPRGKVLLLIYPEFTEFEVSVATAVLCRRYQIVAVAPSHDQLTSEAGMQIVPHLTLAEVDPEEYAALVVTATPDMQAEMENQAILDLIRAMDAHGKVIGAICGAPMLLAKAGILRDRIYTVSLYRRYRDFLGCFDEAYFRNEPIVETENLITAQGFAFVEFGLRLGTRLNAMSDSDAVQAYYRGIGDIHWED